MGGMGNARPKIDIQLLAMPIGNPGDLSERGRRALESARVVFCEDSRKLQALSRDLGISSKAQWISIPGDEEWHFDYAALARAMEDGDTWILVSDAGTPILNDPGRALVEWARKEGHSLKVLPGPSAVTAALQWTGGFGLPFVFLGFAPKTKSKESQDWKKFFEIGAGAKTLIFFDTRHQIEGTLAALIELGHGKQDLFIVREITKTYEELLQGSVEELFEMISKRLKAGEALGELTLVLRGWESTKVEAVYLETLLRLRKAPTKEASKIAADLTGLSARDCYQKFIEDKS